MRPHCDRVSIRDVTFGNVNDASTAFVRREPMTATTDDAPLRSADGSRMSLVESKTLSHVQASKAAALTPGCVYEPFEFMDIDNPEGTITAYGDLNDIGMAKSLRGNGVMDR